MNFQASISAFLWAIVVGMGFTIGSGLIRLVVGWAAAAVGAGGSL